MNYAATCVRYPDYAAMRVMQVICIIARNRRQAVAIGVGIALDKIVAVPNVGVGGDYCVRLFYNLSCNSGSFFV